MGIPKHLIQLLKDQARTEKRGVTNKDLRANRASFKLSYPGLVIHMNRYCLLPGIASGSASLGRDCAYKGSMQAVSVCSVSSVYKRPRKVMHEMYMCHTMSKP